MRLRTFVLGTAAAMLLPVGANAVLIDTSIGEYEVTTVEGYSDSLLRSQVWWENTALAEEFAALVGGELGLPNTPPKPPLFWVTDMDTTGFCMTQIGYRYAGVYWIDGGGKIGVSCANEPPSNSHFAVATPVTAVPEPSMAGLLCLSIAGLFLASRRRSAVKAA